MNVNKNEQMVEHFSNFVNSSIHNKQEFADGVTNEHRYLQQEMFITMLKCMENWSNAHDSHYYDARNEYTVKASKIMIEALKEKGMY